MRGNPSELAATIVSGRIRKPASERWVGRLLGFQERVREAGFRPGARITESGMISDHDDEVRSALRERAVWQLRRIRSADDQPVAIEHAFYPPDIGLALADRDLVSIAMYRVFEEELGFVIKQGTQTIGARLSTAEEEVELGLPGSAALVSMVRLTVADDGRPIEFLRSVYRPDVFAFSINLSRAY